MLVFRKSRDLQMEDGFMVSPDGDPTGAAAFKWSRGLQLWRSGAAVG